MTARNTGAEALAEVKEIAARLSASLPLSVPVAGLTLKSKLPFKALSLRELLIHRITELAQSAIDAFDQMRMVSGATLTRAALETGACLFALRERLSAFEHDRDADKLDTFLMQMLFGGRTNPSAPVALNVLTMIDSMDKVVTGVRKSYDALCEVTHPNWSGTFGAFGEIDRASMELRLGPTERTKLLGMGANALAGTLIGFEHIYNQLAGTIDALNEYFEQPGT